MARIIVSMQMGTTYEYWLFLPIRETRKLEEKAPARKSNIHDATTLALVQSCRAILSAKRAAWPVTLVVRVAKPRKPAALTEPAVIPSREANLRLCV